MMVKVFFIRPVETRMVGSIKLSQSTTRRHNTYTNNGGIHMNKKIRFSLEELTKKNKEELLKDKLQMERIEKRIDEKHTKTK
jgi:hypothetical protein